MAAGDITAGGGIITPEELDSIAVAVSNLLKSTSKDPGQYDIVESMQGITSLPVFQQSGNSYKLVRVLVSIFKGDKGDPFIYSDFTQKQLDALALTYDKLSDAQKADLKIKLADLTTEDIASLQKPATDAAARADAKIVQISEDVNQAITASNTATGNTNEAIRKAGEATGVALAAAGTVDAAKQAALNAAALAEGKAGEAETQAAEAKRQAQYAKEQGDLATAMEGRIIDLEDGKLDDITVENNRIYPVVNGELKGEGILIPEGGGGGGVVGMQYFLRTNNNLDSKALFASKGQPCYLKFTFVSQQREGSDQPYVDTGERGYMQIFARAGRDPYKEVKNMYIESGKEIVLDVSPYLSSGDNNIKINIAGEDTAVNAPALVYSAQLTALSLSANNFQWWQAFQSSILIPLNIGGNISKKLHVDVTGTDYTKSYEVEIGTNIYTETSYNYSLVNPGKTGVFNVSAYISNVDGMIRTQTVSFNIICVLSGATQKLIAINNQISKAVNWSENKVFEYSLYDGGRVSTSARFAVLKAGAQIYESENNAITTSAKQTFTLPLEIETIDNADFDIEVKVMDNTTEMVALTIPVDNSLGFSANAGAVFYLNPRTRSNSQGNRQSIINEMTNALISATWKNFNWGVDGWMTDSEGSKVLRVMAGSSVDIDYKPFAIESARTGKTIEIDYKVDNVTDFDKEVLTIASSAASFLGLKIYPDNLIMFSQSEKNEDFQSLNFRDGQRIRMTLTIMPDAYGNSGFNICAIYINGRKNREFTYENNDYFANASNIVIGSDFADIDLYGIRVYDSALTSTGVLRNYINWLVSREDKIQETDKNNVLDANGSEVAYENVKKQFNVFVFDNTFPRLSNPNKFTGKLEFSFANNPEWNKVIATAEAAGQGTSSMRYWWWNIKFKLKNTTWSMVPGIPEASVLTAKKNFASSPQCHKMGSVNSFDDLYKALGFTNEAMQTEKYANSRVSVYQEPFVGFEKTVNEEGQSIYIFKGLYTVGPDKGDKNTLALDATMFPGLIAIEGSDNAPLPTLFRVPWNVSSGRFIYNEDEEAWQYNGVNCWDFRAGKVENISKYIPVYNHTYECSPRLKPFNGTIAELNAQVLTYRNEPYEYWIAKSGDANQYGVYYYEASSGIFIASDTGNGAIKLTKQLVDKGYGLTLSDLTNKTPEQLNKLFITARIRKFRLEAAQYRNINVTILHLNYVEYKAATDNLAKNYYPYCYGEDGSIWLLHEDDLDSILPFNNQGQPKKKYSVEIHDTYDNGAPVWNGETSNLWNLIELAFPEEVNAGMRQMMTKMQELGGLKVGDDFDKLYAYFDKYYFSKAQKYFCANLYNADAKFTYEMAKIAYINGQYTNDTDPMTQALGDLFSAEQRWVMKRIVYMMSKYSFGMFSANGTDSITVRAAGNSIKYELTPAMDLYPGIASGTSIIRGQRTKAGEICEMTIDLAGSGDQQNTIQGASYLQDIGEWYDKNVTGSMIISGRRLRSIRLGSKTEPITISISSLTLSNCISLQTLSLSRIATLTGTLNLSACTHLKEVYADGTSLAQLVLPIGGGLEHIEYSAYNRYINLQNFRLLESSGVIIDYCKEIITDVLISECDKLNPIDTMTTIIEAQKSQDKHALKRIRCIGFDANCPDSTIDMLLKLADGSYVGLDANGVETIGLPVIEGKIHVFSIREDQLDELAEKFPELTITYTNLKPPTITTFVFSSSSSKTIINATFECNFKVVKVNEYTYKVSAGDGQLVNITFSCDNHKTFNVEYLVAGTRTQNYTVTYIPLRTIRVKVYGHNVYPQGATILIGEKSYTTDANGYVYIRGGEAVSGTVTAPGYASNTFSYTAITNDTSHTIDVYPAVEVKFIVKNGANEFVQGATITCDGRSGTTNIYGECIVLIGKGEYEYTFSHPDYIEDKGTVTVGTSVVTVNVRTSVWVKFIVKSESSSILQGAVVTCDEKTATTDVNGECSIMFKKGVKNYTVSQKTYFDASGTINVDTSNITKDVSMKQNVGELKPEENGNIQMLLVGTAATLNITSTTTDYVIDWGDGTNKNASGTGSKTYTHTYPDTGYYQVEVSNSASVTACNGTSSCLMAYWSIGDSKVNNLSFYYFSKIEYIDDLWKNDVNRTSFNGLCNNCPHLKKIKFDSLIDNTVVTDCSDLLPLCIGLTTIDLTPLASWVNVKDCSRLLDNCSGLTTIDLTPLASWVNVRYCSRLLDNCSGLTTIDLTPLASWVNVKDCSRLLDNCIGLITVDLTPLASWVSVTTCNSLFHNCSGLTTIDLTPLASWVSVTAGSFLLYNCSGLTTVDLTPLASWVSVATCFNLFHNCSGLTTIDLTPLASWVSVKDCTNLFQNCTGLTTIDLTPLVKWIKLSSSSYMIDGCNKLINISVLGIPPFTLSSGALTNGNSCPIYVLNDAVDTYKMATNWRAYADRIKPISEKPAA